MENREAIKNFVDKLNVAFGKWLNRQIADHDAVFTQDFLVLSFQINELLKQGDENAMQ